MRSTILWIAVVFLCAFPIEAQRSHPSPPGLREAEKAESLPLEPPNPPVRQVDLAQLRREAGELRKRADAVSVQIDQVAKGGFPKDLPENLRQIEKLAKRLRSEVSP